MKQPGNPAPECGTDNNKSQDSRTGVWSSQEQHLGWYSHGYLPHFDSPHVIQHITYHLADSLPKVALEQMQAEIMILIQDDQKRKAELRQRVEHYLDAGYGSCVLRVPEVAACIIDTWLRFDGERYRLLAWVVMPNHCHVLIEPLEGIPLGKIVLSWKTIRRGLSTSTRTVLGSPLPRAALLENRNTRRTALGCGVPRFGSRIIGIGLFATSITCKQ